MLQWDALEQDTETDYQRYAKMWRAVYSEGIEPVNPMHIVGRGELTYTARPVFAGLKRKLSERKLPMQKSRLVLAKDGSKMPHGFMARLNALIGITEEKPVEAVTLPKGNSYANIDKFYKATGVKFS